ncbi:MAG: hypothetical protein ACD_81C00062G0004 [uncultured bacterium]|uniref:Extracellular solute-binding protein family 5 n=2 Tax=Candidatus Wolfeibacteriota TaxID=1752735 RepID=A0A0G1H7Y4_9BACT|nr:MAG: hypothetical protein ACD_81C00062G0004 [uncultured bacterium]KKR12550.1 MAG: Extracellular solute-binding protein family 5 [Candidatus Wolfebacteria bacterium GW2011_GWC2_39_22]KKT43506.1 MAG: Extracellular solute-binding protein family 5 [Candidatus Wolfebacteria bacterium GW2011_GWE2_44_13]HBI25751.1 hypothetical protein [Candidatus Wolfebacteria bacterium]
MLKAIFNLFTLFSRKERITFIAAFFILVITSLLLLISIIQLNTILSPVAGGEYVEGIVGQPIFINPLFAESNNPDNDLSQLLFANIRAMAETITLADDGKVFDIRIKGDIVWQDNQPITTDDIIFTIQLIQDQAIASPLAPLWKGVQVERISERELKIITPVTYSFFENAVLSLQPVPKHLFASVPTANIRLSDYNREPIGSGPYIFESFEKRRDGFVTQILLKRNERYFGPKAYIDTLMVRFYQNESDAVEALNDGDIDGMAIVEPSVLESISIPHQVRKITMPRYYAVFSNPFANETLRTDSMKKALSLATDNAAITKAIFGDNAVAITSPIPAFTPEVQGIPEYSLERAIAWLEENDWVMTDSGIRERDGKKLEFVLTVYPTPFLQETAKMLEAQWKAAGIGVRIHIASISDFSKTVIKPRDYELLLFGNSYGKNLDPFSFWESSQKLDPGLNLSLYENKDVDKLINYVRTDFNAESRENGLNQLRDIIREDRPAVFLYSPYYLYVSNKSLKGFTAQSLSVPSDRFTAIDTWYIKTVRTFKD